MIKFIKYPTKYKVGRDIGFILYSFFGIKNMKSILFDRKEIRLYQGENPYTAVMEWEIKI